MVERIVGRTGRTLLGSSWAGRRTLILAYHNIVPDGVMPCGDRSLHLPVSAFARQLDVLGEYCAVVPLARILDPTVSRRLSVAVTFDDAYRGALSLGVTELVRRGFPATVFVPTGMLGDRSFWWDDLSDPAQGLPDGLRARALGELRGIDVQIRAAFPPDPGIDLPSYMRSASVAELSQATSRAAVSLGAHTANHPNLARLSATELAAELEQPLAWLRHHYPSATIPWIAYPYGLSSSEVERAAAAAGYLGGVRVEGGAFRRGRVASFAVPRLNVPAGVSLDGFVLRLAGLRP